MKAKPTNLPVQLLKLYGLAAVLIAIPACESKTENAVEDVGEAIEDTADEAADAVKDATN